MAIRVVPDEQVLDQAARPRVLFIEDNPMQLDLYELVVQQEMTVLRAPRGEDGLALARRKQPDVIVIDVMLPDIDGLAICHTLRTDAITQSIPLVVLTGDDGAYARAQLIGSELAAILRKPCPADRLLGALRGAIQRSRH
jgi:DNA-binding response OmpR family regulator